MQSKFLPKNDFRCIMLYARFLTNFKSHIYKMDIFKNVQNQKLPTNLDRPFFWDPNLGKYAVKNHIVCMYVYNDTTCGVFWGFKKPHFAIFYYHNLFHIYILHTT